MINIYTLLNSNDISYERFDHPAAFTCQQAKDVCPEMPGVSIKNLFLYDKKTNKPLLVVVSDEKQVDLKKLKSLLSLSNLSFASAERLKHYLGVEPGSVTILGLANDTNNAVAVIFDTTLKNKTLQCHPLINTSTLAIPFNDIKKFLIITNHDYQLLDIPSR
jgi:Ala-tRNA(Pro) deacylase